MKSNEVFYQTLQQDMTSVVETDAGSSVPALPEECQGNAVQGKKQ